MITCYIIDDEQHAIETLSDYIIKTPGLVLAGTSIDASLGRDAILTAKKKMDICFLDIDMPEISGIELAGQLNGYTDIVFISGYSEFAGDILEKKPFEFLLKPIRFGKFLNCIERYKREKPATEVSVKPLNYMFISNGGKGKHCKIDFASIIYIESSSNDIIIHTDEDGEITVKDSLSALADVLPRQQFSRIHHSLIVSHSKIKMIANNDIIMNNLQTLKLGAKYRDAFVRAVGLC